MKWFRLSKRKVLVSLVLMFMVYSGSLYLTPLFMHQEETNSIHPIADGRIVWQKYNCQSCHQLYGLGGYLGPDLTNITGKEGRTREYMEAVVKTGNARMPSFTMSDQELESVLDFLESVNKTGNADPQSFLVTGFGMIKGTDE